jgi:type II secretory pathway predicted ATPase ExeA
MNSLFRNPFRPGAGHMPPYLAGRKNEEIEFRRLLGQEIILENLVLTGLRGVGKTVLLESFKPLALHEGWLWAGTDFSESTSVSETTLAHRILADLAVITSSIIVSTEKQFAFGFMSEEKSISNTLNHSLLLSVYEGTPGLVSDRLKKVFETVWPFVKGGNKRGIVFAYDEAQNLSDNADKEQYPLSLLLDVFPSIQRKDIPFVLALTGLPTLFPKLVETRTYTERMFHVVFLQQLNEDDSREAILKPIEDSKCPVKFRPEAVDLICGVSGGYPYFIQFICREAYDAYITQMQSNSKPIVPITDIIAKLDTDFFAGRWAKATDRQRQLLNVISFLENAGSQFSVLDIVAESRQTLEKPFSSSHVNQMLLSLSKVGLVYKNRHGRYSFAVPLLHEFIRRQTKDAYLRAAP